MNLPGAFVWSAYRGAGRLAAPLARPYLARRAERGKEDPERLGEKLGFASAPPFADAPVWLHGVSVGESLAALAVAERLTGAGLKVILTTSTPASAARVAGRSGAGLVHQYAPLDAAPFVRRFLAHWRPRAALFVESEIWPATLATLAGAGTPRAHVNARMSERSFRRWQARPWLARPLFHSIGLALAQSAMQAERFRILGTPDVRATGNIKFDAPAPAADPAALAALREGLGARPVWLAASTHPGEEALIVAAHRAMAAGAPGLVTIIAPRHAERGEAVAALAGGAPRRALGEGPPAGGLYVADTMGELGTFFTLAPVVFLGGSLVPLGGHNPAEPAAHGAAILTGPHFGEMFPPFIEAGAALVADDAAGLAALAGRLLADPAAAAEAGARARAVLAAEQGALQRTMAALDGVLECPPAKG